MTGKDRRHEGRDEQATWQVHHDGSAEVRLDLAAPRGVPARTKVDVVAWVDESSGAPVLIVSAVIARPS